MHIFALVFVLLVTLIPCTANAETVLRTGEDISVTAEQVVDGDYYVWVGPLGNTSMSGSVVGDMYAFGGTVNINGSIGGDLTAVGGTSQLNATVTDDVRIVSGDVTIGEHIGGDLFVIAGKLTLLSSATVSGDVFFFGGVGNIAGAVDGSIMGTSEKLRIDAAVGKNVDVRSIEGVTLGDHAEISGFVTYASPQPLTRAQSAVVEGKLTHHDYIRPSHEKNLGDYAVPFFMSLFAALTFFLLFRKALIMFVQRLYTNPLQSSLFGVVVVLLAPIVSLLLMVTILGFFVGLTLFAFTLLLCVAGYVLAGVMLGANIARLFTKKLQVSLVWIIVGTALLHTIMLIPIVGPLVVVGTVVMTIGALAYSLYKVIA